MKAVGRSRSRNRYSRGRSPATSFLENDLNDAPAVRISSRSRSRSRMEQKRRDWSPSIERQSPPPLPAAVPLDPDAPPPDPVPVPIDDDCNDDLPETRALWGPLRVNKRAVAAMTFDPDDNENQVKQLVDKAAAAWGSDDSFEICDAIRQHYRDGGLDVSVRDVRYYMQNVRPHSKEVEKRLLIRANRMILSRLEQSCLFSKQKMSDGTEKILLHPDMIKTWREQAKLQHKLLSGP